MGITYQKKICLLGSFAVGKTSLIRRFVEGNFDDKYLSTIGVKISRKTLAITDNQLNFLIWDLAGGDDFINVQANYLRGAAGAIIVCDLTRQDTLTAYEKYAHQLLAVQPDAKIIFAANKVDLTEERELTEEMLAEASTPYGGKYFLTSAKSGLNVEEMFAFLANQLVKP